MVCSSFVSSHGFPSLPVEREKDVSSVFLHKDTNTQIRPQTYELIQPWLHGGLEGKENACNAGDLVWIPGSGRTPGEGNGNPLQGFLPKKSHGQRSLVGYSQMGCKESDTTERLCTSGVSLKALSPGRVTVGIKVSTP